MAAKQSKIEEKLENMVETNQNWQKTDKNDRKPWKMWGQRPLSINSVLNVKAVVAALNQEKALVGAFSVITNLRMQFGCNFLDHYWLQCLGFP